ncbi:DUF2267 domain-containing protein [Halolamina litorea]|uniref:DUF2267 domain-containing protein n=1 Tax=Halolamina litorea TaxID=1515593 RepID=A0ABD6BQF3_9EURY|nr:DUF2267 domain-containing protein [Halolamina litorea]
MQFHEFTGEVQHRIEGATQGEAVRATRATLSALGERIAADEAADLAAVLPMEVDWYLTYPDHRNRFDYDAFLERVAERTDSTTADAEATAQAVLGVVAENAPAGELDDVRAELTADYGPLFDVA